MNEIVFIAYFVLFLLLAIAFINARARSGKAKDSTSKANARDDTNRNGRTLLPGLHYTEDSGLVDFDREIITGSDLFGIMVDKILDKDSPLHDDQLFCDTVRRLQPYTMAHLFKVVQNLREDTQYTPGAIASYKGLITASAIVYDFVIPKSLFNSDTVALTYVAAHFEMHRPVSVFDEVQKHIRDSSHHYSTTSEGIVEQHKQITRLLEDLSFANVFLEMTFKYESFLSIDYLYRRWLEQPAVNTFNMPLYKQDIKLFKKLVTMYFGVLEVDVPKDYLYIDTAVCEYILQIRRYDPSKSNIRVVE